MTAAVAEQPDLDALLRRRLPQLLAITEAMEACLHSEGIAASVPAPQTAEYQLDIDPFDQSQTLKGIWRRLDQTRLGELLIRADESVYAELDVIVPHPSKSQWFVEGVTAWGNSADVKTELKLLPAV